MSIQPSQPKEPTDNFRLVEGVQTRRDSQVILLRESSLPDVEIKQADQGGHEIDQVGSKEGSVVADALSKWSDREEADVVLKQANRQQGFELGAIFVKKFIANGGVGKISSLLTSSIELHGPNAAVVLLRGREESNGTETGYSDSDRKYVQKIMAFDGFQEAVIEGLRKEFQSVSGVELVDSERKGDRVLASSKFAHPDHELCDEENELLIQATVATEVGKKIDQTYLLASSSSISRGFYYAKLVLKNFLSGL